MLQFLLTQIGKIKTAVSSLNSDIASHFSTIESGSLHDITNPGIYYLRNAVTDKPSTQGGMYILSVYSTTIVGLFINTSGIAYSVSCVSGTWTYTQLASA